MSDEAKTIYIVTSGSYSDYRIHAVFDDEDRAAALVQFIADARVEEWPLNPSLGFNPRDHAGTTPWRVLHQAMPIGSPSDAWYGYRVDPVEFPPSEWRHYTGFRDGDGEITVWARDKDHALKIAQDKRAEHLATKAGLA